MYQDELPDDVLTVSGGVASSESHSHVAFA
jgi:hypothetical protein